METLRGLEQLARDANAFRYQDLEDLLRDLDGDRLKLAARIALVPLVEAVDAWEALRPIILDHLAATELDGLRRTNVLAKEVEAPRFGHPTRRDAACSFLDANHWEAIRGEAEYLILTLARSVIALNTSAIHFCEALRGLRDTAVRQNLGSLPIALCEASRTLFSERNSSPASMIEGVQQARRSRETGFGLILAAGLVNTLNQAKTEDDLAGRDALLGELRNLAQDYPNDAAVRWLLAVGLRYTLNHAKTEGNLNRRDALLVELRNLARTYPDDTEVRGSLARGLLSTLNHAKTEDDLHRRDALLDELRNLARTYPDDPSWARRYWCCRSPKFCKAPAV